jgi:ornithine cyclodeaminase
LTDEDISKTLTMKHAINAIELSLRAKNEGKLIAPPRFSVGLKNGSLVFTVGADTKNSNAIGFRVYDTFKSDSPDRTQLVAVFDSRSGAFRGIVMGVLIGALRTAAINALAIKYMARSDAKCLGVLGSGLQARTHATAAAVVRHFERASVYSPTDKNRQAFARELNDKTGIPTRALSSAEDVVREADVLICATNSRKPVLDAGWLKPGMHINTIGPKIKGTNELPIEAARKSDYIVTDSLQQVDEYKSYSTPFFLHDTPERGRMVELDELVVGKSIGRSSSDELTLFCSVGLAGTEVILANEALKQFE